MQKPIDHPPDCECIACVGPRPPSRPYIKQQMDRYGWHAEVSHNANLPFHYSLRTYGLRESYDHPELQCCFPFINPQYIMTFWHKLIDSIIKKGGKLVADYDYEGIAANGLKLRFVNVLMGGEKLLRILIPDKDGTYDRHPYNEQLTLLDDSEILN